MAGRGGSRRCPRPVQEPVERACGRDLHLRAAELFPIRNRSFVAALPRRCGYRDLHFCLDTEQFLVAISQSVSIDRSESAIARHRPADASVDAVVASLSRSRGDLRLPALGRLLDHCASLPTRVASCNHVYSFRRRRRNQTLERCGNRDHHGWFRGGHRDSADRWRPDLWVRRLLFNPGGYACLLGATLGFFDGAAHRAFDSFSLFCGVVRTPFAFPLPAVLWSVCLVPYRFGAHLFPGNLAAG